MTVANLYALLEVYFPQTAPPPASKPPTAWRRLAWSSSRSVSRRRRPREPLDPLREATWEEVLGGSRIGVRFPLNRLGR